MLCNDRGTGAVFLTGPACFLVCSIPLVAPPPDVIECPGGREDIKHTPTLSLFILYKDPRVPPHLGSQADCRRLQRPPFPSSRHRQSPSGRQCRPPLSPRGACPGNRSPAAPPHARRSLPGQRTRPKHPPSGRNCAGPEFLSHRN